MSNKREPGGPLVDDHVERYARLNGNRVSRPMRHLVTARAGVKRPVDADDQLRFIEAVLRITSELLDDQADKLRSPERVAIRMSIDYLCSSQFRELEIRTLRARTALSMDEIGKLWRAEGRPHRPHDISSEWERAQLVYRRQQEGELLGRAARLADTDNSPRAYHLREVADQIKDHREAGNWTTAGKPKVRSWDLQPDHLPPLPGPSDARIGQEMLEDQGIWARWETRATARV